MQSKGRFKPDLGLGSRLARLARWFPGETSEWFSRVEQPKSEEESGRLYREHGSVLVLFPRPVSSTAAATRDLASTPP